MPHFDPTNATVEIHTFKEGILAAIGHDLQIGVGEFAIDLDDDHRELHATFDPGSLRVLSALGGGSLSDKDREEIASNIRKKVLHPERYPTIRFTSTQIEPAGEGLRITGKLELHGVTRTLSLSSRREGATLVVEVPLHQPDFGIKPYKAPLGVIKIKPEIRVKIVARP